jgi:hypothetical protein
MGMDSAVDVVSVRMMFADFRMRAGAGNDSVEDVLLDQMLLAHTKVPELYALAADCGDPTKAEAFMNAAARLIRTICELTQTLAAHRAARRPPPAHDDREMKPKPRPKKRKQTGK